MISVTGRLSFDVFIPLLEEATFRGQILEEEGPEARFLLDEARFSKDDNWLEAAPR
jgi:hypothetical protein